MPNEPESTVLAEGSSFCFAFCLSLAKPLPAIVSRQIKTVNRNTDSFTDHSLRSRKKVVRKNALLKIKPSIPAGGQSPQPPLPHLFPLYQPEIELSGNGGVWLHTALEIPSSRAVAGGLSPVLRSAGITLPEKRPKKLRGSQKPQAVTHCRPARRLRRQARQHEVQTLIRESIAAMRGVRQRERTLLRTREKSAQPSVPLALQCGHRGLQKASAIGVLIPALPCFCPLP